MLPWRRSFGGGMRAANMGVRVRATKREIRTDPATVTLREILIGAPADGGALSGARDDQASTTAEA